MKPAAPASSPRTRPLGLRGLFSNPGLFFLTLFRGRLIGEDSLGNRYYERPGRPFSRRWVVYAGMADPSAVPPEWHAWLHHITEAPLRDEPAYPWRRPPRPNLTGTPLAYRPPGHDYMGGQRARSSSDYESWSPDQGR